MLYYTKEEDIRLVSAWLRNSVNPIEGNAKKAETIGRRLQLPTTVQPRVNRRGMLRTSRTIGIKQQQKVTSFNGCYNQIKDTYASGRCDKQLTHATSSKPVPESPWAPFHL